MSEEMGGTAVRNVFEELNRHLFAELERLGDPTLDGDGRRAEVERARAVTGVAQQVTANVQTLLAVARFRDDRTGDEALPRMLGGGR